MVQHRDEMQVLRKVDERQLVSDPERERSEGERRGVEDLGETAIHGAALYAILLFPALALGFCSQVGYEAPQLKGNVMIRHGSIGVALFAAALGFGLPAPAFEKTAPVSLQSLDDLVAQRCAATGKADCTRRVPPKTGEGTTRVRLFEEMRGRPDSLKIPQDARRDASAGVFI
jgi:hypothetical protein